MYRNTTFDPTLVVVTGCCPECGDRLVLRHSKRTSEPFVGCTNYPHCHFTCQYEPVLQRLHDRVQKAEAALAMERLQRKPMRADDVILRREVERELRRLAAACHPDRWRGADVAEELTKQVLALREKVQGGVL